MDNKFFSGNEAVLGVLLCFIVAFLVAELRWTKLYQQPAISTEQPVSIYLHDEVNTQQLADIISDTTNLQSEESFYWAAQTLRWHRFKPGHYKLTQNISLGDLFTKLGKGLQDPIRLTLLPGQTIPAIVHKVASEFRFDSTAFKKMLADSSFWTQKGIDQKQIIGRLYPSTYFFYWTAGPQQVVERLLETFEEQITTKYNDRLRELDKSLNEIVTLASIIEWEAGAKSEKDTISGLYWNRLQKGMKLQADPTINFVVGKRQRLFYKDYKIEHPYNTYLHAGLPPGPITNPSQSSIEAALYPAEHDYLYMVASPKGIHNFSETYQEHQRKSAEWREWLQKQHRIKRRRNNQKER